MIATFASQASEAVAAAKLGDEGHSIGDVTDGQVTAGGVISLTVIVLLQVEVLLQSSVAVHVLVVE